MIVSFSIATILSKERTRNILASCDVVFIPHNANVTEAKKAIELAGDKCVQLKACVSSGRIIKYLETRDTGLADTDEEENELETIYQSLPKGVEFEAYFVSSFRRNEPPAIIILPNEN